MALLKGVNVGGNNRLRMADLRQLFFELGLNEAQTILQSGNVVFSNFAPCLSEVKTKLEAAFADRFGFVTEFVVRSASEWRSLVVKNPFPERAEADPGHLVVVFFSDSLDAQQVALVQAKIKGPERLVQVDNHLFIDYPDGIGTSTVARTPGWAKLTGKGTARNWNTIGMITDLL